MGLQQGQVAEGVEEYAERRLFVDRQLSPRCATTGPDAFGVLGVDVLDLEIGGNRGVLQSGEDVAHVWCASVRQLQPDRGVLRGAPNHTPQRIPARSELAAECPD